VDHVIILNPDILHFLKAHWLASEKPSTGWIFEGYKGTAMNPRNLNHFFKELSVKALGEHRGGELMFKDLRDSFNEVILDSEVNAVDELKNALAHVESENSAYKTRVDALQDSINNAVWEFRRMEALHSVQMGKLFEKGYLDMPIDKIVSIEEVEEYLEEKYGDNR